MLNKLTLVGAAFAMGATALAVPAAPAEAATFTAVSSAAAYGDFDQRWRDRRYYRDDRRYDRRHRRAERRYYNSQRCKDGDGGTVIGAIAGGLLGNQVAGYGDRTLGTVIGAGVGAIAGRAIDRGDPPRGCRRSR